MSILHHISNQNHVINFDNVKILDNESNLSKELLSEMLDITLSQHKKIV